MKIFDKIREFVGKLMLRTEHCLSLSALRSDLVVLVDLPLKGWTKEGKLEESVILMI